MEVSLKKKSVIGIIYKFFERIGTQLTSLTVSVILARILQPEDMGIVTLAEVLVLFFNIIAFYGFGNSIIQKKNIDALDISTAFVAGLFFSINLYVILYFFSPYVESYYKYEAYHFSWIIRCLGIVILISPIKSILSAIVSKSFRFRYIFYASLISILFSGIVSIIMACFGYGIWALVAQNVLSEVIACGVLWWILKWKPCFAFSLERFISIWKFGWKLIAIGILNTTYTQIRSLLISKKYSAADLAYFNKGLRFAKLFPEELSVVFMAVLFPAFSTFSDKKKLLLGIRKCVQIGSFLMFPIICGLFTVANNFIIVLFTEKWSQAVIYLRIFCLSYIFYIIESIQGEGIKSLGRSDVLLFLTSIGKGIGVFLIFITFRKGIIAIALGYMCSLFIEVILFSVASKIIYKYRIIDQIKDVFLPLFLSIVMACICLLENNFAISPLLKLILQIITGILFYLGVSILFKLNQYQYCLNIIKQIVVNRRGTI